MLSLIVDPEIFNNPGHLINRSARLMQRLGDARFRKMGLATAQLPVFGALKDGGSLSQTQLATLANIEQPTMAQLLARMLRDGLVKRASDPADKRSVLYSLTPAAIRKMPQARAVLIEGNHMITAGLTESEIATLSRLLKKVMQNTEDALRKQLS